MVIKLCGVLESFMVIIIKIIRCCYENLFYGVVSVKEWFNYVIVIRNEELNLFCNVDVNNIENSIIVKNFSLLSGFRGGFSYNYEIEIIFVLLRMQFDFKFIYV